MKIETFIKNEVKKYKTKVMTNKKRGFNLDKLELMARQHEKKCEEFIDKQDLSYQELCKYKDLARNSIQAIDDEIFGCFNNSGKCVGYDFYR